MSPEIARKPHPRTIGKACAYALVTLVALASLVIGGLYSFTSITASRLEVKISNAVRPPTPGLSAPFVNISGFPLLNRPTSDIFDSLTIRAEGVNRPQIGSATVVATADQVVIAPDFPRNSGSPESSSGPTIIAQGGSSQTSQGPILPAAQTRVAVLITGDALGRALGLQDVLLANERDSSLAGGTEFRARISGTVPDSGEKISAIVDLRTSSPGAQLVPLRAATGSAGQSEQNETLALERTAWTLPSDLLPLKAAISALSVRGGTLIAEGTAPETGLPLRELASDAHS